MKQVNCLGVAVVDALSGPLERYPVPRVNPQVTTETIRFLPGGGAVNTASALARMGLSTTVFSKVADDPNGTFILAELRKCGVDTTGIHVARRENTPFTFVGIHPDGQRTFIHTPGTNRTLTLDDLDLDRFVRAEFVLYQDLWAMPGVDIHASAELLASARQRGAVTLLDECWGFGPCRETLEFMAPYCDYLLPSIDDMQAIYPGASADEITDVLLTCGAGTVVLKMGADGCLLAQGKETIHVPALPANVVDTTGAGDCWNAGFIAGLIFGESPVTAARIGNACAAFCIEAIGGSIGVPAYATVQHRATK